MNRFEFIRELREAVKNNLGEDAVQENVRYYSNYIEEEVRKGRSEHEVLEELGDPWLLAKTLADVPGGSSNYSAEETISEEDRTSKTHTFHFDQKWKIVLLVVALVLVFLLVFSILRGIIVMAMPLLGPLLIIFLVVKLFSNRKK